MRRRFPLLPVVVLAGCAAGATGIAAQAPGPRVIPVLYLPTSGGDHTEFGRYGMPRVCGARIASGQIQVFTVDAGGAGSLRVPKPLNPAMPASLTRWQARQPLTST